MFNIIMTSPAIEIMKNEGISAFPDECCGFFYGIEEGNSRHITTVIPVNNSKEGDRRRRFEISPLDYIKAENYALQNKLQLLGVYHTHPLHPAIPSHHDLVQAMPYFSYVILSIEENKVADIRSWRLDEGKGVFEEEQITKQ